MVTLGVDFGGTRVKVGIASGGRIRGHTDFPVTGSAADLDFVGQAAHKLGAVAIDRVAIAVPGVVGADGRGLVEAHGKYGWMLRADLHGWALRAFGADATVENDARAALLGEAWLAGAAEANAAILVLGTGIGTAAIVGGRLLRGPDGTAGILGGHCTIDRAGGLCNCGNIGCAELYGGGWALADRLREWLAVQDGGSQVGEARAWWERRLGRGGLGFWDVTERHRTGDPAAKAVWGGALDAWGAVAVSLCHAYDPQVVYLAGGVVRSADLILGPLARHLDRHLWRALPRPQIRVSANPALSVLQGLAVLSEAAA
ncbi:MAG: ROK family protein [Bifidobacteriaceae bacterium]|jgi:glucokinase|nr:ROK family protein [Bifidobacteriaceae bacterium]